MGRSGGLPDELIPDYEKDEEFLKKAHHVLLEVCSFETNYKWLYIFFVFYIHTYIQVWNFMKDNIGYRDKG